MQLHHPGPKSSFFGWFLHQKNMQMSVLHVRVYIYMLTIINMVIRISPACWYVDFSRNLHHRNSECPIPPPSSPKNAYLNIILIDVCIYIYTLKIYWYIIFPLYIANGIYGYVHYIYIYMYICIYVCLYMYIYICIYICNIWEFPKMDVPPNHPL